MPRITARPRRHPSHATRCIHPTDASRRLADVFNLCLRVWSQELKALSAATGMPIGNIENDLIRHNVAVFRNGFVAWRLPLRPA